MTARYGTLRQLQVAYATGDIAKPLMIDNDATTVYVPGPGGEDGDDWECVFDGGNPVGLLEAALDLLGIPHQGA
jgi:hypothetical protein